MSEVADRLCASIALGGKVVDDSEVVADHPVEHWIRPTECSDLEVITTVEPTTQGQMELLG